MVPLASSHLWGRNELSSTLKLLPNNQIGTRGMRKSPRWLGLRGDLACTEWTSHTHRKCKDRKGERVWVAFWALDAERHLGASEGHCGEDTGLVGGGLPSPMFVLKKLSLIQSLIRGEAPDSPSR